MVLHTINTLCLTGNVCCVVAQNIQLLSLLIRNCIILPKTFPLQSAFFVQNSLTLYSAQKVPFEEKGTCGLCYILQPANWNAKSHSRKTFVLMKTSIYDLHKKFYIPSIKKIEFSFQCTYTWYLEMCQRTPWGLQGTRVVSKCTFPERLCKACGSYFFKPNIIWILRWKYICIN